jgi:hypothetical protein
MNDPAGIMAADIGKITDIGIEILFAFRAAVLGITDPNIDGMVGGKVAEVVQLSYENVVAV